MSNYVAMPRTLSSSTATVRNKSNAPTEAEIEVKIEEEAA